MINGKQKTKLTISGGPKKSFKNIKNQKEQGKKTVYIDRKSNKSTTKSNFGKPSGFKSSYGNFKRNQNFKTNIASKFNPTSTSDFEKRKLAEQRATKKFKADIDKEKKTKLGEKRDVKLTVSRALSDEIETRERSLASVKRARQKRIKKFE